MKSAAVVIALALAPSPAFAQQGLLGGDSPEPRRAKPASKSAPRRVAAKPRAETKPSRGGRADVRASDVVLAPTDVELGRDEIFTIKTRLGLNTLIELPEAPEAVWFSDNDRWRLDLNALQLGLAPGKGDSKDVELVDWSKVRETLYVRVKSGFTYKFVLVVTEAPAHSVIRVRERVEPPKVDLEAEARRERERIEHETREREERDRRSRIETAAAAALRAPRSAKLARARDLEARLGPGSSTDGRMFVALELRNRSKKPLPFAISATGATVRGDAAPLAARETRVVVLDLPAGTAAVRIDCERAKPLELSTGVTKP